MPTEDNKFASPDLGATAQSSSLGPGMNPEAFVVHVNTSRAAAGQPFDAEYHAKLSADALPSLVRAAARLAPTDCQRLEAALRRTWAARISPPPPVTRGDWRSMDLPRMRARVWQKSAVTICQL